MSQKPKKKRDKKYDPKAHKLPVMEYELSVREFSTVGFIQKTIQDAQTAMQHMLTNVAVSKWGYSEDAKIAFSIDFDKAVVKVEIMREVADGAEDGNIKAETNKEK